MSNLLKITILIYLEIIIITCFTICNKETNLPPSSKYDCSGLLIDQFTNKDDRYCCYWHYFDKNTQKEVSRCSSINENQFQNLQNYTIKKSQNYSDLEIKCVEDQKTYCSNVVLDEDEINNCDSLAISNEKDKYCCRWQFEDKTNYNKKNDYCASINRFEYLNIKKYIEYKMEEPNQKYKKLSIDCDGKFTSIKKIAGFLNFLLLIIFI